MKQDEQDLNHGFNGLVGLPGLQNREINRIGKIYNQDLWIIGIAEERGLI